MSGQEVCVIIIPNDFPEEKDDDQNRNGNQKYTTTQVGYQKYFFYNVIRIHFPNLFSFSLMNRLD